MKAKLMGLTALAALTATTALASTDATATTDLNMRSLPDPRGAIVDVIPAEAMVSVESCTTDAAWCKVMYDGKEGWAYSPYLTASVDSQPVVLYQNLDQVKVKKVDVSKDEKDTAAAVGGLTAGALAMSAIGGPVAVVGTAIAGAALGSAMVPEKTVTYVTANPTQTVYVDGEVVVGAGVPEGVTLSAVPDSDYSYVYLNGTPVLVNSDRQIVRIIR